MSVIELPAEMKMPYGITAVYLKQLLSKVHLNFDGHSMCELINRCMIDNTRLQNDRFYRVPFFKVSRLLDIIYQQQQDPMIALNAVFKLRVKSFPFVGYAITASRTLRMALERLAMLEPAVWDMGRIYQQSDADSTRLIWRPVAEISPLAVEIAIAGWVSIGQQLFDNPKRLEGVTFRHPCLGDSDRYRQLFGCDVTFSADENSIVFPRLWLDERLVDSDDTLADLMTEKACALIENYVPELNVENTVRAALFERLPADIPELEVMATRLGFTVRKMRYLLNEKGLNYRQIVDDVRKETASYLLLKKQYSIGDIAGFCGFFEQSSFNRAFKRWFGCSPSEYIVKRTDE